MKNHQQNYQNNYINYNYQKCSNHHLNGINSLPLNTSLKYNHHHSTLSNGKCCHRTLLSPPPPSSSSSSWSNKMAKTSFYKINNNENDFKFKNIYTYMQSIIKTIRTKTLLSLSLSSLLVILFLIIILIWSLLLSSIILIHSYREKQISIDMLNINTFHNNIGQLAIQIGNELLSTIEQTNNDNNYQSHSIQQNETNSIMKQLITFLRDNGFNYGINAGNEIHYETIEQSLFDKLKYFRLKCRNQSLSASLIDCIENYKNYFNDFNIETLLSQQQYQQQEQQHRNQLLNQYSKLELIDLSLHNMPLTLFIRGIIDRYIAIGFMSILSTTKSAINLTEFLHYYHSSCKQFESSFMWNNNFYEKYLKLEQIEYQHHIDPFLDLYNRKLISQQNQFQNLNHLMHNIFTNETIRHLQSNLRKKNAESIERSLFINDNHTKFIADLNVNNFIDIPIDIDFLEKYGLNNIEKLMIDNQSKIQLDIFDRIKYNEFRTNQIRFLLRLNDYLSISISTHLQQIMFNEQTNFTYHSIIITILIVSLIFAIIHYIRTAMKLSSCDCSQAKFFHSKCKKKTLKNRSIFNRRWFLLLQLTKRNKKRINKYNMTMNTNNNSTTPLLFRKYYHHHHHQYQSRSVSPASSSLNDNGGYRCCYNCCYYCSKFDHNNSTIRYRNQCHHSIRHNHQKSHVKKCSKMLKFDQQSFNNDFDNQFDP